MSISKSETRGEFRTAFVTGATGLLGNNLVRALLRRGVRVTALVRSMDKARRQFGDVPVRWIEGDVTRPESFAAELRGCDVLFHTAAYFRTSYQGGNHERPLEETNVQGTARLLEAAYAQGVRRFVHTSSSAVLTGPRGAVIDETMRRPEHEGDPYYLSKVRSEKAVDAFHAAHPEAHVVFVLPGWMFGPGDLGPTSSGRLVQDFLQRKLPGRAPGSFSVVDARDVADVLVAAAQRGRDGERYLAAGHHHTMTEVMLELEKQSGVPAPKRELPLPLLYVFALSMEAMHLLTRKPVLIGLATVRLLRAEAGRSHFSSAKAERELGARFRPLSEVIRDAVAFAHKQLAGESKSPGEAAARSTAVPT